MNTNKSKKEDLEKYHGKNFTNDEITWELIEEANIGLLEKHDIYFYCETLYFFNK